MLAYLVRRLILAVLTIWAVSVLSFVVIQLPPGDYITSYIAQMSASGSFVSEQEANALRQQYGLDQPQYIQYIRWMKMVAPGQFRHGPGVRPARLGGDRRPHLAHDGGLRGGDHLHLGARPCPSASTPRCASTRSGTTSPPSSASSAWPCPVFMLALILMYFGFTFFNANVGRPLLRRVRRGRLVAAPSSGT